jgi:hypothetical protein
MKSQENININKFPSYALQTLALTGHAAKPGEVSCKHIDVN